MQYLYTVNKQIGYITSAHLILFSIAAGFFFISKISSAPGPASEFSFDNLGTGKAPVLSATAAKGKTLFTGKCAVCHHIFKKIYGPPLQDFESRGPWSDRKQLYQWIRNPDGFMKKNLYTAELKKQFDSKAMSPFPALRDEEIDAIVDYISAAQQIQPVR